MSPESTHGDGRGTGASAPASIDPVCGMTVDPTRAAGTAVHEGRTYYFCSPRCLHQFGADPARYAGGRPAVPPRAAEPGGTAFTCPMHPEVRQDVPGTCPKCGMAL
ncbi:MAG: YHS domain-containing protein, partial [Gemmataceae bacterium]|nr:YHS domain-containing protein [Gemmataceae bacterium]